MDKNTDIAIAKYLDLIKQKFSDIECAYLFGSYAKGKSTADSDIDVALIFRIWTIQSDLIHKFN